MERGAGAWTGHLVESFLLLAQIALSDLLLLFLLLFPFTFVFDFCTCLSNVMKKGGGGKVHDVLSCPEQAAWHPSAKCQVYSRKS